jgi:hypothetical protein
VIEIAEKILNFEPHHRLTVLAGATITFNWFVGAVQAGRSRIAAAMPAGSPLASMSDVIILGDRRKALE